MKKITFLATVISVLVLLASCSEKQGGNSGDDGTVKVSGIVQDGTYSSECTNVRAIANDENTTEIARGNFSNNSFSLILPKDVPAPVLVPIESGYFSALGSAYNVGLSFSNPDTRSVYVNFAAYKVDSLLDALIRLSLKETSLSSIDVVSCIYFYADSECTVTGNTVTTLEGLPMTITINVDVTLHKGWTKVYGIEKVSLGNLENMLLELTIKNMIPPGYDFKWYFSTDITGIGIELAALSDEQKTIIQNFFNRER